MENNDLRDERVALKKFGAISIIEAYINFGLGLGEAIAKASKNEFIGDDGTKYSVSRASLYRWYKSFKAKGLTGLCSISRPSRGSTLPEELLRFLINEKQSDHEASIPEIIERAKALKIIAENIAISRSTVYRTARSLNLPLLRRDKSEATYMRPFSYEHRMMMVMCDGKHFRAGAARLKRVAFFFIDDATRYVLDAFVGYSENSDFFLISLFKVISNFGFMNTLYFDNGSAFSSDDSKKVLAKLGITYIYGTAGYPEGRAKIERFNGTVTQDVLRALQKPEIDPDPAALELRLRHYIREVYNKRLHEGTHSIPEQHFLNDTKKLSFPLSEEEMQRSFIITEKRKVRRDNVISWSGFIYEVPLGYAGKTVTVYRHILEDKIWMHHKGQAIELLKPDLAQNARDRRVARQKTKPTGTNISTAAEIKFNREFASIVNIDGGYLEHNNKEKKRD